MIVRDVFERFYAGESLRSLARLLDDTKVPTRSVLLTKGKLDKISANPEKSEDDKAKAQRAYDDAMKQPWSTRTVRDMLTNVRYAGWAVYQGKIPTDSSGEQVRGQWEALIAEEVFEVVQARLSDPARKTNRVGTDRRYIGSGLFVCDTCDGPIQTINRGKYYCQRHLIREHRHVDRFVKDVIAERLADPKLSNLLAPIGDDMKPVIAESKRLRARLAQTDDDYDNDVIDGPRWKAKKKKILAELAEVDKKLATRRGGGTRECRRGSRPRAGVPRRQPDGSAGRDRGARRGTAAPGRQGPHAHRPGRPAGVRHLHCGHQVEAMMADDTQPYTVRPTRSVAVTR